jgi:hypothetical protein
MQTREALMGDWVRRSGHFAILLQVGHRAPIDTYEFQEPLIYETNGVK